jgi:hypothetical protein
MPGQVRTARWARSYNHTRSCWLKSLAHVVRLTFVASFSPYVFRHEHASFVYIWSSPITWQPNGPGFNTQQQHIAVCDSSYSTFNLNSKVHSRLIHCELEMSYNPRMSMAPPNTQQRNQRKKEEESDAFMRLVSSPRDEA